MKLIEKLFSRSLQKQGNYFCLTLSSKTLQTGQCLQSSTNWFVNCHQGFEKSAVLAMVNLTVLLVESVTTQINRLESTVSFRITAHKFILSKRAKEAVVKATLLRECVDLHQNNFLLKHPDFTMKMEVTQML
jgi:hypothetical protein